MNRDSANVGHHPNANEPPGQPVNQGDQAYFAYPQGHGAPMLYQGAGQQVVMAQPQQQPIMQHQNMAPQDKDHPLILSLSSEHRPDVQPENSEIQEEPVQVQETQHTSEGPAQQQQQSMSTAEELSQQSSHSTPVPEVQQPEEQPDVDVNQPTVQEEVVPDQKILDEPILEEPVHTTQSTVEDRPIEEQTLQQQPISEEANQEEVAQDQPNLGEPISKELPVSPVEDYPMEDNHPTPQVLISPFKKHAKTHKNSKKTLKKAQRLAQKQVEQSDELALQGCSSQSVKVPPAKQATDSTVSFSGHVLPKNKTSDKDKAEQANGPKSSESATTKHMPKIKQIKVVKAERQAEKKAPISAESSQFDDVLADDLLFKKYNDFNIWMLNGRELYEIQLAGIEINEFEQGLREYKNNHKTTQAELTNDSSVKLDLSKRQKACSGKTPASKAMIRKYAVLLINLNGIVIQDVMAIKAMYPEEWKQKLDKEYLCMVFNESRAGFDLNNVYRSAKVDLEDPQWKTDAVDEKLDLYVQRQSAIRLEASLESAGLEHALDKWLNEVYSKIKEKHLGFFLSVDREKLIKNYKSYWWTKVQCMLFDDCTDKLEIRARLVRHLSQKNVKETCNEPLLYDTFMLMKLDQKAFQKLPFEDSMRHVNHYLHLVYGFPQ